MATRLRLAVLLAFWPAVVSAQVSPFPSGVTPPIFGLATAVDGGGSFSPQLFGPQSCTVPAYSFTGATTSGYGLASSTACVVIGGVPYYFVSANLTEQRNGTTAQRANTYNTYTSSTNYEAFSVDWQTTANVALVGTRTAATGNMRPLRLVSQSSTASDGYGTLQLEYAIPFIKVGLFNGTLSNISTATTGNWMEFGGGTSTATSGTSVRFAILPTYNQSSGTASNTDLLINRTQTAVGSGTQRLIDAQVGGSTIFAVGNGGQITSGGAGMTVANVGANSCGTTAATIAGNAFTWNITVGATGGTQCRVTFPVAAPNRRNCVVTDETTANLMRTAYVDATNTDVLGTMVAGDVLTGICVAR